MCWCFIHYSMDTVLKKHSTSVFRKPYEETNSKFLRNTATQITYYPNLDNIMFILHCESSSSNPLSLSRLLVILYQDLLGKFKSRGGLPLPSPSIF